MPITGPSMSPSFNDTYSEDGEREFVWLDMSWPFRAEVAEHERTSARGVLGALGWWKRWFVGENGGEEVGEGRGWRRGAVVAYW